MEGIWVPESQLKKQLLAKQKPLFWTSREQEISLGLSKKEKKKEKKGYLSFVCNKNCKKAKEYVGDELRGNCESLGMDPGLVMESG